MYPVEVIFQVKSIYFRDLTHNGFEDIESSSTDV